MSGMSGRLRHEAGTGPLERPPAEDAEHGEPVLGARRASTSATGVASANSASSAAATASSSAAGSPSDAASRRRAAAAAAPRSRTRRRVTPVPSTPTATVTDARSWPRRRVRRSCALAIRVVGAGISTAVTSSAGPSVVTPERTKNASSGIRRSPAGPATTTTAPWTRSAGAVSAAGDALHRFPASVARFRICTEPTTAAASASAATSRRITGCAAISVIVVVAPMTSEPPAPARIPGASSGIRFTSTTSDGVIVPSRSRITRSVPPARTRASGPCSASRATASASVPGRAYANGCIGQRIFSTSSRRTCGVAARMKKNGRSQKRATKAARRARSSSVSTSGMTWPGARSSFVRK